MQLQEVQVAFDGKLIVDGALIFPPDREGIFLSPQTNTLSLSRDYAEVAPCEATKTTSGFYDVRELGLRLYIPEPFQSIIRDILRRASGVYSKEESLLDFINVKQNLSGVHGQLNSKFNEKQYAQSLSDWELETVSDGRTVEVIISSSLYTEPFGHYGKSTNFWDQAGNPRLKLSFCVGPSTRHACCGAIVDSDPKDADSFQKVPDWEPGPLSLRKAPIGSVQNEYGWSENGWVHVFDGRSLALTYHRELFRRPDGFLAHTFEASKPRILFEGVNLSSLASMITKQVKLSGPGLQASAIEVFREGRMEKAQEAQIELALGAKGLKLQYGFTSDTWKFEDNITIPWEALILRFPKYAEKIGMFIDPFPHGQ